MRRLLAPFVAALLLLGGACSSDDDGDGGGSADDTTTTAGPDTTDGADPSDPSDPSDPEPAALVLLDPGAEPRTELRYAFVAGTASRFTTTTVIDQEVDGVSPGPISTTVDLSVVVLEATAEQATFTLTFGEPVVETEPGTPSQLAEAATAGAAVLTGAVATITVDRRGAVLDLDLELADEAGGGGVEQVTESLLDSLMHQGVVLPAEPVGVDARWQIDATSDTANVTAETQQVFTVVGIDDAGVDLEYTLTGTYADAAEGTSTGRGTLRVDFGAFHPTLDGTAVNELTTAEQTIVQTLTQVIHPA